MVLAPVDAFNGTRGCAAVQQASASHCKGTHPYSTLYFNVHMVLLDCKGPYALTGPLPACIYGTLHWGATQYTYNHACSRTVYVLHTRVVTFLGKNVGILMLNKRTFTMVLGAAPFLFS